MSSHVVKLRTALAMAAVGTLGFVAAPSRAAAQVPRGSYAQSCRNEFVGRNGILHAECRNAMGSWKQTSIAPSDCADRDIINLNGVLACGQEIQREGRGRGRGPWHGRGRHDRMDQRQNYGLTLFTDRRFRGRSMYVSGDYGNLGSTGFNDAVSSIRIDGGGTWRLCSDKNYGGRCVDITSSVSDLNRLGLGDKISSVRRVE